MNGSTQIKGQFAQIGVLPHAVIALADSAQFPGQIVQDQTTKSLFIGRPDSLGAPQLLAAPANPVNNNSDGSYMVRVGGVNFATRASATTLRVQLRVVNPLDQSGFPQIACRIVTGLTSAAGATAVGVNGAGGTALVPPIAGGGEVIAFDVIPQASTGLVDVTITYGATGSKPLIIQVGPNQLVTTIDIT